MSLRVLTLAAAAAVAASNYVGGYLLINPTDGVAKLQALAASASTLPINRLWVSFVSPSLVYIPGSETLENTGLGLASSGDYGFAILKSAIATLQAGGVEVFISAGGWNDNCFPYAYTYYSIGAYGTGPNYWKIAQYSSNGELSGCTTENEWCYTCEPPVENATLADYGIFPEPFASATWQAAVAYITQNAGGSAPPTWMKMEPNTTWTDPKNGLTVPIPGDSLWFNLGRDPYADLVTLASELGASGIDLDYEEMWHADYFKVGPAGGPWQSPQTTYKWSAIAYDLILNIKANAPQLKLSTPAGAASAWSGNWWGGNLKGILLNATAWYPEITAFMTVGANAGGVNVMTYDLSDNEQWYECPTANACTLDQQVAFYMQTYSAAGIAAGVGYEIGTPAYPDPIRDPTHQLPLTSSELALILANTQPSFQGGFFWELYKTNPGPGEVTPTQLAQQLCALLLPGQARCSGVIPPI